ncbi:hypothetical protein CHS0354_023773 [Potamilus streckersoni]|uniref:UDP-MurNAc-pentapeptide synthetase n=1 Tax=Potamilus streckersoni TaxID=2493646 RepID=A0AAE0RZ24_9BIVA|nr:hypothetical protein CHS0354_023773 [Potamilus streckersoni]
MIEAGIASRVCIDSRKVVAGCIFVAVRGEKHDGHIFLNDVVVRQASIAIVDKVWHKKCGVAFLDKIIMLAVNDTVAALQHLSMIYREKFSIPVVAIGGNSGKTTTKEILHHLLSSKYDTLATEGNLNNHIGVPLTLLRLSKKTQIAVIEMGMNHKGEMAFLCDLVKPTCGLITNIGTAHAEFFSNEQDIAESEGELFDYLIKTNGALFINIDDENVVKQSIGATKETIKTYSMSSTADVQMTDIACDLLNGNTRCRIRTCSEIEPFVFNLIGKHNAQNVLAAVTVGTGFDISLNEMMLRLSTFKMKEELKRSITKQMGDVFIINDSYNANPESMNAVLDTIVKETEASHKGRKIAVLGDMLELGSRAEMEHYRLGKKLEAGKWDIVLAIGTFAPLLCKEKKIAYSRAFENTKEERNKLIDELTRLVQCGDIILFKGSRGMLMEELLNAFESRCKELRHKEKNYVG